MNDLLPHCHCGSQTSISHNDYEPDKIGDTQFTIACEKCGQLTPKFSTQAAAETWWRDACEAHERRKNGCKCGKPHSDGGGPCIKCGKDIPL